MNKLMTATEIQLRRDARRKKERDLCEKFFTGIAKVSLSRFYKRLMFTLFKANDYTGTSNVFVLAGMYKL